MKSSIKNLFSVIVLIFLGLFIPFKSAFAGILSIISGIGTSVPSLIIAFVIFICGALAAFFAGFAGMVLSFVISPDFTALSYTDPAGNPVIKMGLSITQGFANIILVLILIYIAIATILRLAGYETKKLLPKFIIVALLVNFTPIMCGLIVDATNIAMNHFAEPLKGPGGLNSLIIHIKSMWDIFASGFDFATLISTTAQLSQIFKLIAATIFYFFLGLILLWFAGVFAARYIAIWILVILSPIAFVCFILPKGAFPRRAWDIWWTQFIQWSIIGIIKMFFLYMGIHLMVDAPNLFKGDLGVAELGWFTLIFPYIPPLVFLYLGMVMSYQTTAFAAGSVITLTKKGVKGGGKFLGQVSRRTAGRVMGAKGKEWAEKQASARFMPEAIAKKGVWAKAAYYAAAPATGAFWALRRGVGEAGLRLTEVETKDVKTAEEKYKGTLAERKLAGIRDALKLRDFGGAAGIFRQSIEEEQIDDLRKLGLSDPEVTKIGKETLRIHPEQFKKIRNAFPRLAAKMGEGFTDKIQKGAGLTVDKEIEEELKKAKISATREELITASIALKIRPDLIIKMEDKSKLNPAVMHAFHRYGSREQIASLMKTATREVREEYIEHAKGLGMAWFEENNPPVGKFLKGPLGETLYGGIPKYPPKKEEEKTSEEKMEEKLRREAEEFRRKKEG